MKLKRISFDKYKSINKGTLDIEPEITCLIGMNEAGKSILLMGIEKIDKEQEFKPLDIARQSQDYTTEGPLPSAIITFTVEDQEKQILISILGLENGEQLNELVIKKSGSKVTIAYPAINPELSTCKVELLEAKKSEQTSTEQEAPSIAEETISTPSAPENPLSLAPETTETPLETEVKTDEHEETMTPEIIVDDSEVIDEIIKRISLMLPRFKYFDSVNITDYFLPSDGVVSIKKLDSQPTVNQPVINLLKLAEIEITSLKQYKSSSEKTRRDTVLKRGSERLNEKLLRAFWPINAVRLQLTAEEDTLKIRVVDNEDFAPGERSRGIQWALAFNVYFLAECGGQLKDTVLLIDEPGIFLHIDAQIKMLESTFKSITKLGNQIVYSTHLPFLIDKRSPERIRILNKPGNSTEIGNKAWSTGEFGSIPEPARSALGINFDDIFMFGEFNLIVEGPSDQIYLNALIQKIKPELAEKLTIVPAYGKDNIGKVIAMSVLANKSSCALVDVDFDMDKFKSKLGSEFEGLASRVNKINEMVGSEVIASTEDLLSQDVFIKSLTQFYNRIRSRDKLDPKSLKIEHPYVYNTEVALTDVFKAKHHKLQKTDLAREASQLIPDIKFGAQDNAKILVEKIYKLLGNSNGA